MRIRVRDLCTFRLRRGLSVSRYVAMGAGLALIALWIGGDNAPTWQHASQASATVPRGWQTTDAGWGITAHHPPTWATYPYDTVYTGGFATVGYLSTQTLHKPCVHVSARSEHIEGTCAPLLRHLAGNGVLIQWNFQQPPGHDPLSEAPGTPAVLAGRAARVQMIHPPKSCSSIGGARLMAAAIGASADPDSDERWYVTACLGPTHMVANEIDFLTMLKTATLPAR